MSSGAPNAEPVLQGKAPVRPDRLSTINNALSVGSKLSFTGGFLVLVWYCISEGISFPVKSVSQAVSTFAVSFVLVMLIGVLTVYSYIVIQPVLFIRDGVQRRKNGGRFWVAGFDA
ncbi:hypothetical protein Q4511_16315 [Paracoccus sp. 1_MG-2023]|nr:hypothetical protein [Paracoccus sp. 1_MG-2023]MDO6670469.1 hypothetical protein [Paracoccus sp. 1_MG-2023]